MITTHAALAYSPGSVAEQDEADRAVGEATVATLRLLLDSPSVSGTVAGIASIIVQQALQLVSATDAVVGIVPAERPHALTLLATAGSWATPLLGSELPVAGTVEGRALATGRAVQTTALQQDSMSGELPDRDGMDTALVVPLRLPHTLPDGRPSLGFVGLYRPGNEPFSNLQCHIVERWALLISGELHRAELQAEASAAAQRFGTVLEVAVDLTHSLQPRSVVHRLLRRAVEAVNGHRAVLLEPAGHGWRVESAFDVETLEVVQRETVRSGPALDTAMVSRTMVVDGDFSATALRWVLRVERSSPFHSMLIPLVGGGEILGLLLVVRRAEPAFTPEERRTMLLISNVAATALRNAQLYVEAQRAHQRMVALENVKGEFLRLASHELRGPLGLTRGYISMMEDGSFGELPQTVQRVLPTVLGRLTDMNRLIEQMLETARLEDEQLELRREVLDLRGLAREAVNTVRPLASTGHELHLIEPNEEVPVLVDAIRTEMMLATVLENAIKYSPAGGDVSCTVSRRGNAAQVAVADHGLGIPPEALPRLFTRFGRIVTAETAHVPGTGLGLYLAREVALLHGGDLEVESSVGHGSVFTLRLPSVSDANSRSS